MEKAQKNTQQQEPQVSKHNTSIMPISGVSHEQPQKEKRREVQMVDPNVAAILVTMVRTGTPEGFWTATVILVACLAPAIANSTIGLSRAIKGGGKN